MTCQLIFLVFCVLAALHDVISRQGCCGPQQWTGVAIQKTGIYNHDLDVASIADLITRVSYSYHVKKISIQRMVHNITTNKKDKIHKIFDYNQGIEYTITNGKYCTSNPTSGAMWQNCIPDNSTYFGSYNVSGPMIDVYRVVTPSGATIRVGVTPDSCHPVFESLLISGPVYTLEISVYENVTMGISYPSDFDVPEFCHHNQIKKKYVSSTITELIHSSFSWR
ncbi:mammalian ependymin-related protein 1-like [Ostrea edulis]|uniref:mammalian ependymin-related protein 1-like n=1 Tax=Ostrea edulis TaxID=37623 RepID=UPI0020949BA5|nr:mammalian ependymin-related protein 1-like [Ostrea edulis]